jgi:aminomethyltransferase
MADDLRRTPLHALHAAAGARFGGFAGWDMPIRYGEVRAEHLAVRTDVGCFDVSHMGQIEVRGPKAQGFLAEALTNDPARASEGEAQYTLICQDDGGAIDDLILYRRHDRYLLVVNAGNIAACLERLTELAGDGVVVEDLSEGLAMLAVQGPHWRAALTPLSAPDGPVSLDPFHFMDATVGGVDCLVARTGYTGEPGVELICESSRVADLWRALMSGPHPPSPAGLGARDTLRLEMGYPLYGNELNRQRTPVEAGLGWACDLASGAFRGADVMRAQRDHGTQERLVAFAMDGAGIPRSGCEVRVGGQAVGTVTSGSLSPSLGIGIGMAYVTTGQSEPGTEIEIMIRERANPGRIRRKPLVNSSPRD